MSGKGGAGRGRGGRPGRGGGGGDDASSGVLSYSEALAASSQSSRPNPPAAASSQSYPAAALSRWIEEASSSKAKAIPPLAAADPYKLPQRPTGSCNFGYLTKVVANHFLATVGGGIEDVVLYNVS